MPTPRTHTVHTVVLWPFIEAIRRLDPTAAAAAPELAAIERMVGTRMPHDQANELLDRAVAVTGRKDLGVLAAEAVEPGHFELVELASRAQRSVGEGLRTLASLVPILD